MANDTTDAAWSEYWKRSSDGREGCLPGNNSRIGAICAAVWAHLATALPPGAAVLDLATGDGSVPRELARGNNALDIHGVDRASPLPPTSFGATLRGGVDIAALPFPAGSFDAITSQFGIEYARLDMAVAEAGRVLKPGSKAIFLSHCSDSPVLAHNLARVQALEWGIAELDRGPHDPAALRDLAIHADVTFGKASPARQAVETLLQSHATGADETSMGRIAAELVRRMRGETARINALAAAAQRADDTEAWRAGAARGGLTDIERFDLRESPDARPFARVRVFIRR